MVRSRKTNPINKLKTNKQDYEKRTSADINSIIKVITLGE